MPAGLRRLTNTTASGVTTIDIDGDAGRIVTAEETRPLSPEDIARARLILPFYQVNKANEDPKKMRVRGMETVNGHDAYVVDVPYDETTTISYWFDVTSGLLLRRSFTTQTIIAPVTTQADFDDYRTVNGARVPFYMQTSDNAAYSTTTRRITELRLGAE